uniref:Expressed protein n=1 Tax=Echinococcus granulosus TaxID=6210 RepID=A0A068WVK6_ECHGR|nr:expressed protein [Echinococcus granulosus]
MQTYKACTIHPDCRRRGHQIDISTKVARGSGSHNFSRNSRRVKQNHNKEYISTPILRSLFPDIAEIRLMLHENVLLGRDHRPQIRRKVFVGFPNSNIGGLG